MAQWFDQFAVNLGNQMSPFGFAPTPGVAPSQDNPAYQAGINTIGDIGFRMLANSSQRPMEALGQAYIGAQEQGRQNSKEALAAQQMMQQAEENRQKRQEEADQRKKRNQWLQSISDPNTRAMLEANPGLADNYIMATNPVFSQPAKPQRYSVGGALVDENGNVVYKGQSEQAKPPTGYRFTAEGNMEYIPGGPADPKVKASQGAGGVTTKMHNDAVAVDQAYRNLSTSLDQYKNIVNQTGISMLPGQENDQVQQARTNLQLQLKELYNLGVLNGPDLSLMENMIFDPQTSVTSPLESIGKMYSASQGEMGTRASASIDQLKAMLKTIRDNKTRGILDDNGNFVGGATQSATTGIPNGITPEEWNAMSEEDRALWK